MIVREAASTLLECVIFLVIQRIPGGGFGPVVPTHDFADRGRGPSLVLLGQVQGQLCLTDFQGDVCVCVCVCEGMSVCLNVFGGGGWLICVGLCLHFF